jgi:hypothetical protein
MLLVLIICLVVGMLAVYSRIKKLNVSFLVDRVDYNYEKITLSMIFFLV